MENNFSYVRMGIESQLLIVIRLPASQILLIHSTNTFAQ